MAHDKQSCLSCAQSAVKPIWNKREYIRMSLKQFCRHSKDLCNWEKKKSAECSTNMLLFVSAGGLNISCFLTGKVPRTSNHMPLNFNEAGGGLLILVPIIEKIQSHERFMFTPRNTAKDTSRHSHWAYPWMTTRFRTLGGAMVNVVRDASLSQSQPVFTQSETWTTPTLHPLLRKCSRNRITV